MQVKLYYVDNYMRYKGVKGKVWKTITEIVKIRDGDSCFTCYRSGPDYLYDTGHYRPVAIVGSNNTRAWNLKFIKRQCKFCNGPGQGEQVIFRANLVKELGEPVIAEYDRLVASRSQSPVKNWDILLEQLKNQLQEIKDGIIN